MRSLLLILPLLLGWANVAAAAGCVDEAQRLAARYKLTFLAPMTSPQSGAAPATADARGTLAAPDTKTEPGATAPPAAGSPTVGSPTVGLPGAATSGSALDGAPAPAQTGSGSSTPAAEPPPLKPTQRARMEELLSQARAAELDGRSDDCFRHLREAQSIASSGP
jgi:hypothetical protein